MVSNEFRSVRSEKMTLKKQLPLLLPVLNYSPSIGGVEKITPASLSLSLSLSLSPSLPLSIYISLFFFLLLFGPSGSLLCAVGILKVDSCLLNLSYNKQTFLNWTELNSRRVSREIRYSSNVTLCRVEQAVLKCWDHEWTRCILCDEIRIRIRAGRIRKDLGLKSHDSFDPG